MTVPIEKFTGDSLSLCSKVQTEILASELIFDAWFRVCTVQDGEKMQMFCVKRKLAEKKIIHGLKSDRHDLRWQSSALFLFQAYHSQYVNPAQVVGNMALLPLRTQFKGPSPKTGQTLVLVVLVKVA